MSCPDAEFIDTAEFARRVGVAASTVRAWVKAGHLVPAGRTPGKVGRYRFLPEQVASAVRPSERALAIEATVMAARQAFRIARRGRAG
jgi:predicted site-specific integrase-resolvase